MLSNQILTRILLLFLSSRIFFFLIALLAPLFLPQRAGYLGNQLNPKDHFLMWVWANFDGYHYLSIASLGYQQLQSLHRFEFAFFPLYPLFLSLLYNITHVPYLYLGIALSLISFLAALMMIYKITLLDFNKKIAILAVTFLSFFPLSFFYQAVYTDALFLLLTTGSFYFARKNRWLMAGVFGGLASLDRLSGLSLIPALSLEWYLQNRQKNEAKLLFFENKHIQKLIFCLLLAFLGFLTYTYYLQTNFGDWLLFQKSMIAWKQDQFILPLQTLYRYLKIFFNVSPNLLEYWVAVLEFVSFIFYLILTFFVWKKIRSSYAVFMLVLLLLVTFTGTLSGGPRYILHLFPGFLGLAFLSYKNKSLKIALILLFLVLSIILTSLFTRGYYIS